MANIATEAGAFFQTDAELQKQKEKEAKYNYTAGDCIKLTSKGLALVMSPNGQSAYVAESGFLAKRINLKMRKTERVFRGHTGPVTSLALSYDGVTLWTGSWDKTIKKWDTQTGECLATLAGHTDFVKSLVLVGNTLYSGSSDKQIRKWDVNTNTCLGVLKQHTRAVECLAVDAEGKYLYSGSSDKTIAKWDLATQACVNVFDAHETSVYCVRIWEDEMWTASADKTVRRWNTETGVIDTVLDHPDRVKSVALIGGYVVTGASDDNIRVWDIASGKLTCTIEGHFDEVSFMETFNSELYSVSLDCSLRHWTITGNALKEYAEATKAEANKKPEPTAPAMTEEEERELAELLSDSDE